MGFGADGVDGLGFLDWCDVGSVCCCAAVFGCDKLCRFVRFLGWGVGGFAG